MKRIKFNSGGQPFANSDFALQQTEIYKAIENQFLDTDGVVLSGCVVTGNNISLGLVYLDGKVRELAAATGLSFPCYIRAAAQIDYDSRVHSQDNQNKTTKSELKAEIVGTQPITGNFITVTASGVNKRLQYILKNDQNSQYNVTGYSLNIGKVSYVKVSRINNQTLSAGENFVTWQTETDDLNEFNTANSEFTAINAGIYSLNFTARVDLSGSSGFAVSIQVWESGTWVTTANSIRNVASIQGSMTTSTNEKLSAGQRVRFLLSIFGTGFGALQFAYASITRIA
jgi:hypothetical protein